MTVLDQLVSDPAFGVPVRLLANRLALKTATATSKLEGRLAREADTFVTTETLLTTFDLQTLRDLPELELAVADTDEQARAAQF